MFLGSQYALSGDFTQNLPDVTSMDNPDIQNSIGPENSMGFQIFDSSSAKVIRTKNKHNWFKGLSFGKKKKNIQGDVFTPDVIDYDYDIEKEEIIPVVNEVEKPPVTEVQPEKTQGKKESSSVTFGDSTVNIYCDNMDYDDETQQIIGTGNVKVVFTENNSVMTTTKIVYNHDLNYIEGIGNVHITKGNDVLDGDYTKIDLNYGNVMIDKPIIDNYLIKVVAKTGNVTTDSIEAYDGIANANVNFEKRMYTSQHASMFPMEINSYLSKAFYPKDYRKRGSKYHIKTKELYVNSTDGHDIITFKKADIYCGKVLLLKGTDISLSTDKSESFVETTLSEIGSMRYVGAFTGPGFVFHTPKSSTLKLVPIITLDGGKLGLGIMTRFYHKLNSTSFIYSSAANEFVAKGRQKLGDTDFSLEYGHMSYMNEWFLGSNISKYIAQLVYQKRYIFPDLGMNFSHRATAGYLTDLKGNSGTARFRYQAMLSKNLIEYSNFEKKLYAALDISTQGMMGVYGTGDTIGLFRIGPSIRTQFHGWGQQLTYFQTATGGGSPLKLTDDYRYGGSTINLIETLRINKYLSLGYAATLNLLNNDITTRNMFSESSLVVSIGPDDAKLSIGYDMIRQATLLNYTAVIGAKHQDIAFKKLFMKNPDKFKKEKKQKKERKPFTVYDGPEDGTNSQSNNSKVEKNGMEEAVDEIQNNTQNSPVLFDFGGFGL